MYNGLNSGKTYQVIGSSGYGNDIYLTDDGYIGFTHHGSSAKENTVGGLAFILDSIFKMKPSDFRVKQ